MRLAIQRLLILALQLRSSDLLVNALLWAPFGIVRHSLSKFSTDMKGSAHDWTSYQVCQPISFALDAFLFGQMFEQARDGFRARIDMAL
jgi:hypothetical protein